MYVFLYISVVFTYSMGEGALKKLLSNLRITDHIIVNHGDYRALTNVD
jgi:hypothetical protein